MSLAWAPLAIILLLLPGIFFFIGLASYERLSREIVRSGVISEVAMATVIAIAIHTGVLTFISASGFRLSEYIAPLIDFQTLTPQRLSKEIASRALPSVIYLAVCTAIGFGLGVLVALGVVSGLFRRIVAHRWVYDLIDANRKGGIVTAYVMTTLVEDSQVLMYKGLVHDIFLGEGGKVSYIILRSCSRYSMQFKEGYLLTTKQLELFGDKQGARPAHVWDRLIIDGSNIANVLFDSSPEITGQAEGQKLLEEELAAARQRARNQVRRVRETMDATARRIAEIQRNRHDPDTRPPGDTPQRPG